MDPNAALQNLGNALGAGELDDAREAFDALNQWLTCGGFLPMAWDVPGRAVRR